MRQDHDYFELLVPASRFEDYGGWTLDSQFASEMGAPYLLAHGVGVPCRDAATTVHIPSAGEYRVWVRAKDWVPDHHPGRFQVLIDGEPLPIILGESGKDWNWELADHINLPAGEVRISLHDMTGFDGRCDCLYITNTTNVPPFHANEAMRPWRKRHQGGQVPACPRLHALGANRRVFFAQSGARRSSAPQRLRSRPPHCHSERRRAAPESKNLRHRERMGSRHSRSFDSARCDRFAQNNIREAALRRYEDDAGAPPYVVFCSTSVTSWAGTAKVPPRK